MKKKCSGRVEDYFSGCLYFTAGRLYRSVDRLAFEAFKQLHLAPTHAFFIMALNESNRGMSSPSELSTAMNLDRSTVTRLIATLVKKDLVKSKAIGRNRNITLTSKGHKLLPEIKQAWRELYSLYVREFGEKEANAINAAIRKNLELVGKTKS